MERKRGVLDKFVDSKAVPATRFCHKINNDIQYNNKRKKQKKKWTHVGLLILDERWVGEHSPSSLPQVDDPVLRPLNNW